MKKRITSALLSALLCLPLATGAAALDWSTTASPSGSYVTSEDEILSCISISSIESHRYYCEGVIDHYVYYCSAPCKVTVLIPADLNLGSSMQRAFIADDGTICFGKSIAPTYSAGELDFSYESGTYWELDEGVYYMWSVDDSRQVYIVVGDPENIMMITNMGSAKMYLSDCFGDGMTTIDDNGSESEVFTYFVEPGTSIFTSTEDYSYNAFKVYNYYDPDEYAEMGYKSRFTLDNEGLYIVEASDGTIINAFTVCSYFDTAPSVSFTDVPENEYYFDPVCWAVDLGITNGMTPTTFEPQRTCTRGQIITFLWRAAGCPEPNSLDHFSDVDKDQYYAKAAAWAYEKGIASGKTFRPTDDCTRLAAVEFMWKYDGAKTGYASAAFTDVSSTAVNWALASKITTGMSATNFGPDITCTRGQIVTFLYRAFG